MSRWQQAYQVGQIVSVRVCFADGEQWVHAKVVRKTARRFPIVSLLFTPVAMVISVNRKGDIRPVFSPARSE